ncbi:MAG: outer membrane protein assembly factor BamB [Steroidobacteraceae bacterium]
MKNVKPWPLLAVAALALLAGCSKKDKAEQPAELTEFRATAKIERVWTANAGGGAPKLRLGLGLATAGDAIYAAGRDGDVVALNRANGKSLWRKDTKLKLSGGPGVGAGLVVVGASYGAVVALDAASGEQKWKAQINSEILAAPAVGPQLVLVRTVDGRVIALNTADGSQAWSAEQQVPRLSLRGTTAPTLAGDLALSGFDNGRVMALSLADGATVWDVSVAPPSGRTELQRLVDVDAGVLAADNDIFAVTFQGKAARIDRETGQVQWSRDLSSYSGAALDAEGYYVSTSDGGLVKIGRRSGIEIWNQQVLVRRRLSAPAVLGTLVAVGDLDGYVHFFDSTNGELAARTHPLGARVSTAPLVSGDLLVMMDADGKIAALRATPTTTAKKD